VNIFIFDKNAHLILKVVYNVVTNFLFIEYHSFNAAID